MDGKSLPVEEAEKIFEEYKRVARNRSNYIDQIKYDKEQEEKDKERVAIIMNQLGSSADAGIEGSNLKKSDKELAQEILLNIGLTFHDFSLRGGSHAEEKINLADIKEQLGIIRKNASDVRFQKSFDKINKHLDFVEGRLLNGGKNKPTDLTEEDRKFLELHLGAIREIVESTLADKEAKSLAPDEFELEFPESRPAPEEEV
jgi:hypothetical protein